MYYNILIHSQFITFLKQVQTYSKRKVLFVFLSQLAQHLCLFLDIELISERRQAKSFKCSLYLSALRYAHKWKTPNNHIYHKVIHKLTTLYKLVLKQPSNDRLIIYNIFVLGYTYPPEEMMLSSCLVCTWLYKK